MSGDDLTPDNLKISYTQDIKSIFAFSVAVPSEPRLKPLAIPALIKH